MQRTHLWRPLSQAELCSALRGAVSIETTPEGVTPWRARYSDRDLIHPELLSRVRCAAGVRLLLRTEATAVRLRLTSTLSYMSLGENGTKYDLVINGVHHRTVPGQETGLNALLFDNLPKGEKELEIYFPPHVAVVVHAVELAGGSAGESACTAPQERPRWITHGSSITHCRLSASPAFTWPAIVARERGWDHWNMGYGGQCRFDQIVARAIRDMPAERISLCLGINTSVGAYTPRTWRPAVEGFLMTIRDGHPKTPLLIISPILSPPRETHSAPPCTLDLQTMRRELEEIVSVFRAAGDQHISYLNGLCLIGPGDEATMPDALHPDADGICLMAQRFLDRAPAKWQGQEQGSA